MNRSNRIKVFRPNSTMCTIIIPRLKKGRHKRAIARSLRYIARGGFAVDWLTPDWSIEPKAVTP